MPLLPLMPKSVFKLEATATYFIRDSDLWILRLSATKCQRDMNGLLSTTCLIWDLKSSSLRVGPDETFAIWPLATEKLTMNDKVPCRMYSNSLLSIFPGAIGNPGCLRRKMPLEAYYAIGHSLFGL